MIIRKPYAFLIKNFRLIHLFILLVSSYIFSKTIVVLNFFNDYVETRQFIESDTLVNDIIPIIIMFLSIFLIAALSSIVFLFKKKDKPILFYVFGILYYFALIVICFISRGMINTIIFDGLDPRISRIIRDIWLIIVILQVSIVVFSLIRTLGFDIRKFNFGEDVHELQIDDEDSEEIELTSRFDADKAKMSAAMKREELKSFFFENKLIILLILFMLCFVMPSAFIAKNIVDNKRYKVGEVIKLKDFNLTINESYITKKDYKGDILLTGDNSYLIVNINVENFSSKDIQLNLNNLRLEVNDRIYVPKTNLYDSFVDIGTGYNNNKIPNGKKDYIIVYAIKDEDLENEMIVRYANKLTVKNSQVNAVYYRTVIKPENIDKDKGLVNRKLNEDLIIEYKELKGTKLNIFHYNIKDKFTYEVNGKTKYIINNVGLVLSLNYTFESKNISFSDFISRNAIIRYKYNNTTYEQKINDITPNNYKTNEVYFAVSEKLKDAKEIALVVNVRKTEYVYKLK